MHQEPMNDSAWTVGGIGRYVHMRLLVYIVLGQPCRRTGCGKEGDTAHAIPKLNEIFHVLKKV